MKIPPIESQLLQSATSATCANRKGIGSSVSPGIMSTYILMLLIKKFVLQVSHSRNAIFDHPSTECPDRRKINRRKQQKSKVHVPVPGVDPSQKDIEAAQKYQKWMVSHVPPKCFCGNLSRLKKLKKKKTESRAAGKYFFFCATKKGENPCRYARLVDEVMKEENRKGKRASGVTEGSPRDSTSAGLANEEDVEANEESSSQSKGSSELGTTLLNTDSVKKQATSRGTA